MKKTIVAMVVGIMAAVSAFGITACAEEKAQNPVVDIVEYKEGDGIISGASVVWYDEAGNEYRRTIKTPEKKDVSCSASWTDEAGNKYVSDGHTVTVYDCSGNVIAVKAQ